MKFTNFWYILVLTWYGVNFNQIRTDLSLSDACKPLGKKSPSGEVSPVRARGVKSRMCTSVSPA